MTAGESTNQEIHLRACAKVTSYLEVTGRRSDGYHLLRSEMVTIDLADDLFVQPNVELSLSQISTGDPRCDQPIELETNLIARALRYVNREAAVRVRKQIPIGGGLGGGSADAAAILRWAGETNRRAAVSLGGDVPFCLRGGRAIVEGVGEQVTDLRFEIRDFTLIIPAFAVATARCYEAYDHLVRDGYSFGERNHLEAPARLVSPELSATLDWVRAEFAAPVQLCGSGSTMFLEGHVRPDVPTWSLSGPAGELRFLNVTTTPSQVVVEPS